MTDTDTDNAVVKQNGDEDGEEDESEGEISEHICHTMALQCVDSKLDCMGQRWFKYCNMTAARKICTAVRSLNTS
jgi:hypothetical protein